MGQDRVSRWNHDSERRRYSDQWRKEDYSIHGADTTGYPNGENK